MELLEAALVEVATIPHGDSALRRFSNELGRLKEIYLAERKGKIQQVQ
jgi:hypothetical protein